MSHTFDVGGVFPRNADISRLEGYQYLKALFDGSHYEAFVYARFIDTIRDEFGVRVPRYKRDDYLIYNMMALIAKVSADLLFGEDISLQTENDADQAWLEEWAEKNHIWQKLYQAGLTAAYMGDVGWKTDLIDGETRVSFFPPTILFPGINVDDMHAKIGYATIAWVKKTDDDVSYLQTEEHYPDVINHRIFLLKEAGKSEYNNGFIKQYEITREIPINELFPDIAPTVQTGIDELNIGIVPNFRDLTSFYGISDIATVDSLQAEINNRLTANRVILNRHANPKLGVPKGFFDRKGSLRNFEVYELDEAGKEAKYVTWDGKLDNSFNQIKEIVDEILTATETSPALLGMDKGGVESGRALKYKMLRTMSKIKRKQQFFDTAIRDIVRVSRKLEGLAPIELKISWPDGLPTDDTDVAVTIDLANRAGAISTEEKVRRLNPEWSQDQVEEEVERIAKESLAPQVAADLPMIDMEDENGEDA